MSPVDARLVLLHSEIAVDLDPDELRRNVHHLEGAVASTRPRVQDVLGAIG